MVELCSRLYTIFLIVGIYFKHIESLDVSEHVGLPQKYHLTPIQQECELESINIGTRLADRYNSFDEETEWDTRIHHDYLTKYLGFAGWIQIGLWKNTKLTALRKDAVAIHRVSENS